MTTPDTITAGRNHQIVRWLWRAAAITSVGWFVINVPFAFDAILDATRPAQHRLTATVYAAYTVGLDTAFVALCVVVAVTIFRRKSSDPMALLTAYALVTWSVFNGLVVQSSEALGVPTEMGGTLFFFPLLAISSYFAWMLFFYWFPTGRFTPGWTRIAAAGWVLFSGTWGLFPDSPYTAPQWPPWLFGPVVLSLWGSFAIAQIHRYRTVSTAEQRSQMKWVVYGVAVVAAGFVPSVWLVGTVFDIPYAEMGRHMLAQSLSVGFISLIPLTIGIAVLRHRLYDIDILMNRTLTYAVLTLLIIAAYIAIVTTVGEVFQARGSFVIALGATGVIAVIFQPLRARLQRGINRLMFGQRDDPVGVLTSLTQRLEVVNSPDAVLPALVETIATTLKLPYVALQTPQHDGKRLLAQAGAPLGTIRRLTLTAQHRDIGDLLVAPRSPHELVTRADERLLEIIMPLIAATVQVVLLNQELRTSRHLIVTSREEERRRLRRDLHDGLGPVLAAIAIQADTARDMVETQPSETAAVLASIVDQTQAAIADIRRLVYGLRPPALDELGLVDALRQIAQHHGHAMRIRVDAPDELPALTAAVEVAVYRIAHEAITNAVRHAHAAACEVSIRADDGWLRLVVTDDGVGLPDPVTPGVGLVSMRERVSELGGTLALRSSPEGGTRIDTVLPLE